MTAEADLAAQVRELVDRRAILDCLTRLARGMDRHDAELMTSAYHPDAVDDHGTFRGPAVEFIEYVNGVDGFGGAHSRFPAHQHALLNHSVDLDGDDAHAETYYLFTGELPASAEIMLMGGRYVDHLTRRDGEWRILTRRVVAEWTTTGPSGAGIPPGLIDVFTRGRWDRDDVSYQRPLHARAPGES
jgi:hypothetical protein